MEVATIPTAAVEPTVNSVVCASPDVTNEGAKFQETLLVVGIVNGDDNLAMHAKDVRDNLRCHHLESLGFEVCSLDKREDTTTQNPHHLHGNVCSLGRCHDWNTLPDSVLFDRILLDHVHMPRTFLTNRIMNVHFFTHSLVPRLMRRYLSQPRNCV